MPKKVFDICAEWDAEARVWYVAKSDVPGLAAEAATIEALIEKLHALVPELLQLNRHLLQFEPDGGFALMSKRVEPLRASH